MTTIATESRSLLSLLAWLSPAFPVGGFAYSHGLEWAIEAGDIRDGATLREWLLDVLLHGSGRTDAILLRAAYRSCNDLDALVVVAETGLASVAARERREETLNQGRAFALGMAAWGGLDGPEEMPYPVAVGIACGRRGVPEDDAVLAWLQAFAANLISAAVRLVPLGQSVGLLVLAALEPVIVRLAAETRSATLDDLGGCAFRSDLAAMRHETQYTRLFRS
ncbi:MAG TPA: urease accessory protein UreF [Rhodopila sp.]|uniref:urease accessory protein UreF n=1 Tax=Rhodopila sp. TaxID=2480087 RepID=UPI002B50F27C|nr:urease accessory protein UreF [Rhodopila sp.]HVY16585.1 urease accessory protein UreF [Rhodopila sp.]